MRIEDWHKVEELLADALDLEPARRGQFLAEIAEPGLRREVESLLACEQEAGGFLDAPALALSADFFDEGPEARAGQKVGHYRIIREVGRGGMGTVFLAERSDGEFEQRVALKVVRRSLADAELKRRFRRERQILASLSHENIARLLDGGVSADGEPYLVMEYVEGVRVDEYCDGRRLAARERLRLFLKVCDAVAYAHQRLVVHRDLKPSNVLVTKDGVPKLLDFGIAKLLDPEQVDEQTRTEHRAFTPDYASPEQVRGESVTTVSDVYSLGVLLRNLLHSAEAGSVGRLEGWRSGGGAADVRTNVTNLPTRPEQSGADTARRLYGAELRNIVLMATREESARRYQSVAQLAEDVRRHLSGLPVRAQPDSFTYRASKFVRRNRAAATAATLVVVALVTGLALALWQAGVARRERERAERRFADVRQLSNALLTDIAPKIENLQGATEARQSVVTQSLKYLDSLAREIGTDAQLQSELATAYERVGDIQGNPEKPNLGDVAGAITSYEKAQRMRLELLGNDPDDFEQRRLLAANHQALGYLRWQANELEEASRQTETALRLYEQLAAERPDSTDLRLAQAQLTYDAGDARKDKSNYAGAIAYFQKALELLAPLLRAEPHNVKYLKLAATCHSKLGNSLSWEGRQKEGEEETQIAVRLYESLAAAHPHDVSVSNGLWQTYWMASSTYEDQDDALSHEYALKALKTIRRVVEQDPANSQAREDMARTLSALGQTSAKVGKAIEGIAYAEQAVAELMRRLEADPRSGGTKVSIGVALMRLAEARAKQNDFAGALAELERAERISGEVRRAEMKDTFSLRHLAVISDYRAEIHLAWSKTLTGAEHLAHKEAARNSNARTLEILEQMDAQKTLPESDREWLGKLRADLSESKR